MSTKPSTAQLPTWDTNLTNTVALINGHKTDGFANNEVPTAGEINTLLAFLYLHCKYLNDGDLTGNLTASSLLEGSNTSLIQFRDYKNQARTNIDHFGYRGGQVSEWDEHWRGTVAPAGWTFTVAGAGSATVTDPTSTFQQRYLTLLSGNAASNGITCTPEYLGFMDNTSEIVEDFTVETTTVAGTVATNYYLGMQFSGNAGGDFVFFGGFGGVANWVCYTVVNNVLTIAATTAVAFAANTKYRFRIECIGSSNSSQVAGTFEFRFYINGVLVATKDQSTIVANKFRPYFRAFATGAATADAVHVGRLKVMFNHVLASDAL